MNAEVLVRNFGNDYPAAVVMKGVRVTMAFERRFCRYYHSLDGTDRYWPLSKFMDASASISAMELQRDWSTWSDEDRLDFCVACRWLFNQADFADMLRFIISKGGAEEWRCIAMLVAQYLPCEEAFRLLSGALSTVEIGNCVNILQAITETKHSDAGATLRRRLRAIRDNPLLWNDDEHRIRVADEAVYCIKCLIELGASPADFEQDVRWLSQHVYLGSRGECRRLLSDQYSWLK
jgi:hypothetical protein